MWRQVGILGVVGTLLWAQLPVREGEALDRVVAIVGGEAVFASDVEAQRQLLRQQFPQLQLPDSVLWQRALEALVDEKLMLLQAQEDSIVVSDDEVMQRLEFQLQLLVQQFGSERRVEQLYGMPLEQIRREYREEVRKRLLVEKLQQRRFGNVECSAREVEQFFQQYRDSLPPVPAQVELAHLVRYVRPDSLQRSRTLELALRLRDSLLKGADFAELARRYSGDAASAAHGGELGWIERGKLLPEYERAAFGLQIGEISAPVETPWGTTSSRCWTGVRMPSECAISCSGCRAMPSGSAQSWSSCGSASLQGSRSIRLRCAIRRRRTRVGSAARWDWSPWRPFRANCAHLWSRSPMEAFRLRCRIWQIRPDRRCNWSTASA